MRLRSPHPGSLLDHSGGRCPRNPPRELCGGSSPAQRGRLGGGSTSAFYPNVATERTWERGLTPGGVRALYSSAFTQQRGPSVPLAPLPGSVGRGLREVRQVPLPTPGSGTVRLRVTGTETLQFSQSHSHSLNLLGHQCSAGAKIRGTHRAALRCRAFSGARAGGDGGAERSATTTSPHATPIPLSPIVVVVVSGDEVPTSPAA